MLHRRTLSGGPKVIPFSLGAAHLSRTIMRPGLPGRDFPYHCADEPWHLAPILSERAGQVKPEPRGAARAPSTGALSTDLRDRKSTRLNSSHDQISYAV